jgi:hypothetical protein
MSRIRSLHPGLFSDEAFASLPMAARMLLMGIWTEADDHGIFEWKPFTLKMKIFPAEAFTAADIEQMMVQIASANCIHKFEDDGKAYAAVRNFSVYQRPRFPTYRYPFPEWCRNYVGIGRRKAGSDEDHTRGTEELQEPSGRTTEAVQEPSRSPTENRRHRREEERREVGGKKKPQNNTESRERERVARNERFAVAFGAGLSL